MKLRYMKPVAMFLVMMMLFTVAPAGAVFANGEEAEPITVPLRVMVVEDTTADELEKRENLSEEILVASGIIMPTLTDFSKEIALSGATEGIPSSITVGDAIYEFAGFLHHEYDEATETDSYSCVDTYTIAAEPQKYESDGEQNEAWFDWFAPISDGIYVVYKLHEHTYSNVYTFDNGAGHYKLCTAQDCPDENKGKQIEVHTDNVDTVEGCSVCHYSSVPLTITVSPSYLIGGGTVTVTTNKYAHNVNIGSYYQFTRSDNDPNVWTYTIGSNKNGETPVYANAGTETVLSEKKFMFADGFRLLASPEALSGGGTVTLMTTVPAESVTCNDASITVTKTDARGDCWAVTLPNKTATYTFTAILDNYTATCTVNVTHHWAGSEIEITGSMPEATVGSAYSASFSYSGEVSGVVFWNATGLPDGLTIDKSTGVVSGTPVKAGTYNVTISMGATGGGSASEEYTLTVNKRSSIGDFEPKKTELVYEDKDSGQNSGRVSFKPNGDTELPKDAELVVEPHEPELDDLDFLKPEKTVPRVFEEELSDVSVIPHGFGSATFLGPDGVEHTLYETIMIDGLVYYIYGGGEEELLLYGKNGNTYRYDGDTLLYTGRNENVTFPDNEFISINGAVYQILYKEEWQGDVRYVLYLDGKPVGECYNVGYIMDFDLTQNKVLFEYFDEEYTPDRVKERQQQDDNELGTIIPGADSHSGLEKGKTYEAYVIGAQEISVEGTDRVSGTITQKFIIPAAFVGRKDVQYVAVHTTESGAEFGEVTVSKDGKRLEAVYYVNSLSPFAVYAFVEQTERIVMQIDNTTILANGRTIVNDVAPVIVDNRTMVPIRVITEILGGTAGWNGETKVVTINIDGKELSMTVGKTIDGFDTAPVILNSRTYVPVRYVAEAVGAKVQWEASTCQIVIEK